MEIVGKLDRNWRFPSKEAVAEYERVTAEEEYAAEEDEADPAGAEEWKSYHQPYREDEPRIASIDLSFHYELRRLVAKWGRVPRKQKAEPDKQREER